MIRAHLRHSASKWEHNPCFIITPHKLIKVLPEAPSSTFSSHLHFYRWQLQCDNSLKNNVATFLRAKDFDGEFNALRYLKHCDGLVFAPTDTRLRLQPSDQGGHHAAGHGFPELPASRWTRLLRLSMGSCSGAWPSTTQNARVPSYILAWRKRSSASCTRLPDSLDPSLAFVLDVLYGRDLCVTASTSDTMLTIWEQRYSIEASGPWHTMSLPPFSSGIVLWQGDTVYCYDLATCELRI